MTYSYSITYTQSGDISQLNYGETSILQERIERNERVLEIPEPIDINRYKVVGGVVTEKSPEELAELPEPPPPMPNMAEIYEHLHS